MPRMLITETPVLIQRTWNDGLYNLRVKRNGNARGVSIEEKAMFVLGLGWKWSKDSEVEDALQISLSGLTQEAKYVKIGQVLWEQCSPDFIAKMISSLSNVNRAQSIVYENIAKNEAKSYKGYFNRYNNKLIKSNSIDPGNILDRERKQTSSNLTNEGRNREYIRQQRKNIANSRVSSKRFDRRVVKFKATSGEMQKLANELELLLKTHGEYKNNIAQIAQNLGIEVQSGSNTNYLIEEIKGLVVTYVENEILHDNADRRRRTNNVYLRVDSLEGIDTIKRLLKYTSYSMLSYDGELITAEQVRAMAEETARMREMATSQKLMDKYGNVSSKNIRKREARREKTRSRILKVEQKGFGGLFRGGRVKPEDAGRLYEFLVKPETGMLKDKDGADKEVDLNTSLRAFTEKDAAGNTFSFIDPFVSGRNKYEKEAFIEWAKVYKTDIEMASMFRGRWPNNTPGDDLVYLIAEGYDDNQVMELLIEISNGMGIRFIEEVEGISPGTNAYFMYGILKRFLAIQKQRRKFTFGLTKGIRDKKRLDRNAVIDGAESRSVDNFKKSRKEAERYELVEVNGVYKPVMATDGEMKLWRDRMQPVYVMGGSIYTFGGNGGFGSPMNAKETKELEDRLNITTSNRKKKLELLATSSGNRSARSRAARASKMGINMGAFGTVKPEFDYTDPDTGQVVKAGDEWSAGNEVIMNKYLEGFMKDKMFPEIATKLKPGAVKTDSVQPVFITNAGINTSNIETTALLNLLPQILKVIPVVGGAAAMAVDTVLQSEIDAAKTLPKFARGGSFTTMNSNVSQFIAGDSINNRINPERVTVDWSKQRVNVQPLRNNIANVETGKITDPILSSSPTVTITEGNNKGRQAISVMNSVNPFDENLKVDGVSAKPMEVLLALAESLISINNTLSSANQLSASHATMTAKAVDAINSLANMSGGSSGVTTDIFASLKTLARGD